MNFNDYSIDRPRLPITAWMLGLVIAIGLLVLGIAAYNAFIQVMDSRLQAILAAALIEISAIVEALSFVRGKNWIGAGGLAISLLVSGTYNYIQAQTTGAANGITGWWQLGTLAFGPLIALAFLSLTLGQELRRHEAKEAEWTRARAAWRDKREHDHRAEQDRLHREELDRQEADRRAEQDRQEAERKAELDRQEADRRAKQDIELARIEAENKQSLARIEAETRENIAKARAEAKERARQETRQIATNVADSQKTPTFARGYDGFVDYVHWITENGRTFDKSECAQEMGRSVRQIERYIETGRSNGVADMLVNN